MSRLDVLIIGAGTAGQTAAHALAAEGYRVAVVDNSGRPGGVCALSGCQAKKWFYELAEIIARCRHLQDLGITGQPTVSWQQVLKAKNSFTSSVPQKTLSSLQDSGIDFLEGTACFSDPNTIMVGDSAYKPRFTIIATGARPAPLPIEGSSLLATSRDFLDLEALPERLILIGGGFISFEFAHFAARLGIVPENITIIEAAAQPLDSFDEEMVEILVAVSREEGIKVRTEAKINAVSRGPEGFVVTLDTGEQLQADLVVHGAGRAPDIEALNLKAAGIAYNHTGIEVDEHMRSSNQYVFAVGDCAASIQLARVADREAQIAAASIAAHDDKEAAPCIDYRAVPAVLFTYPQLGMVGKTEQELIREGVTYRKSFAKELSWNTYRRVGLKQAAYKILVDEDDLILGAHFISDNATGMVNTFKQAMLDGKTVTELHRDTIMSPYPSRESDIIYMLEALLR